MFKRRNIIARIHYFEVIFSFIFNLKILYKITNDTKVLKNEKKKEPKIHTHIKKHEISSQHSLQQSPQDSYEHISLSQHGQQQLQSQHII